MTDSIVAVARCETPVYPETSPFHPGESYPEALFPEKSPAPNPVYETVRMCLEVSGLDRVRRGTRSWNPFAELLNPGQSVLLKPNLIKERHPRDPEGWRYVITHGSVIRAVSDYVWKAIGRNGRIILADAPQTDSSFAKMRRLLGLDELAAFYGSRGLQYDILDLRKEEWLAPGGVVARRRKLDGDPCGYVRFDLGSGSEFAEHDGAGRYYGADYDTREVNGHHSGGVHEYLVSASVLNADAVINLPKLKTHKKAGVTIALKNLVGVNGDKNWLPHYTESGFGKPGDERPDSSIRSAVERRALRAMRRLSLAATAAGGWVHRTAVRTGRPLFGDTETTIRSGNWWGNDTIWRTCLDLNKIVLYGTSSGALRTEQARPHYALVDGFLAGAGSGPMNPDPVRAGVIAFGINPAAVDAACSCLMGYDPDRIPLVRQAFRCRQLPLARSAWRDVRIASENADWAMCLPDIEEGTTFQFRPHFGWAGHIERS